MQRLSLIFAVGWLFLALQGCVTAPARTVSLTASDDSVPATSRTLSEDELYDALMANIAMQHEEYEAAVEYFSRFIQATHDQEYARNIALYLGAVGQYEHAITMARLLLDSADEKQSAIYHRLILAFALKAKDEAVILDQLEWAIAALDQENKESISKDLYQILRRNVEQAYAVQILQQLQRYYKEDVSALRMISTTLMLYKEWDAASEALEQAFALDPQATKTILLQTRLYVTQQDRQKAIDYLYAVLLEQPENYPIRNAYAQLLLQGNRLQDAKTEYLKMSGMGTPREQADALYTLSLLMMDLREFNEARENLHRLSGSGFHGNAARYYLGVADEMEKHPEAAIEHYRKVVRNSSSFWLDAQSHIARLIADTRGDVEALDFIQGLDLKKKLEKKKIWTIEADILIDAGRMEEAEEVFDRVLELYPNDVNVLYNKAILLSEELGVEQVEAILLKILKIRPDYAHALNSLGYTLADKTQRYDEALGYIQRALELLPENFAVLDSMGWVQYRLGHLKEARGYLEKAFDGKMDPEIASHLGEVFWVTGEEEKAREVWGKALLAFPKNKVLIKVIEKYDE